MGLTHDAGVFFLVAALDLDLSQARGVFHHHAATLPAALFEGGQRRRHGAVLAIEFIGQYQRVFDADAGTRGQMRRGGMDGIADQRHPPLRPGTRQQQALQRTIDDA